jgi:hypothetical protein
VENSNEYLSRAPHISEDVDAKRHAFVSNRGPAWFPSIGATRAEVLAQKVPEASFAPSLKEFNRKLETVHRQESFTRYKPSFI